ncbi:MAG: hypothetical protein ACLFUH_06390 [Bacteroidales bacterium]
MIKELKQLDVIQIIIVALFVLVALSPIIFTETKELVLFLTGTVMVIVILFVQAQISIKQSKLLTLEKNPNVFPELFELVKEEKTVIKVTSFSKYPIKVIAKANSNCPESDRTKEITLKPNNDATISFHDCNPTKIEIESNNLFEPGLTVEMAYYPEDDKIEVKTS